MREHSNKVRVICLDRENSARSQMAEAFLRHLDSERFEVCSGGIEPLDIHPLTRQVMTEIGVPLLDQAGKSAQLYFGKEAFQVAIMISHPDEKENPRLFPGALRVERWPNEDPLASKLDETARLDLFRRVRDRIQVQAQTWITAQKDAETGVFSAKRMMAGAH
ncbi:MAG: arsenate reductase ArsC [Planctomycetes bacterium]|jgi:arsenate reductase|nr:arsenate reductase ArsC [Planctomycetota bacterium]